MCQSVITVTVCVCVWACIWCVASTVSSAVGHRRQFRGMRGIHWGISQYLTMVLFLSGEDTEMTAYLGWIMHRILLKSLRGIRVSPVLLTYWRHCNQVLWMTWFISVNWLVFLSANRIMPTILISIVHSNTIFIGTHRNTHTGHTGTEPVCDKTADRPVLFWVLVHFGYRDCAGNTIEENSLRPNLNVLVALSKAMWTVNFT